MHVWHSLAPRTNVHSIGNMYNVTRLHGCVASNGATVCSIICLYTLFVSSFDVLLVCLFACLFALSVRWCGCCCCSLSLSLCSRSCSQLPAFGGSVRWQCLCPGTQCDPWCMRYTHFTVCFCTLGVRACLVARCFTCKTFRPTSGKS